MMQLVFHPDWELLDITGILTTVPLVHVTFGALNEASNPPGATASPGHQQVAFGSPAARGCRDSFAFARSFIFTLTFPDSAR